MPVPFWTMSLFGLEAALASDEQLLLDLEAKKQVDPVPNQDDAYQYWQERRQRAVDNMKDFDEFPQGSVQWHLREQLKAIDADRPFAK